MKFANAIVISALFVLATPVVILMQLIVWAEDLWLRIQEWYEERPQ